MQLTATFARGAERRSLLRPRPRPRAGSAAARAMGRAANESVVGAKRRGEPRDDGRRVCVEATTLSSPHCSAPRRKRAPAAAASTRVQRRVRARGQTTAERKSEAHAGAPRGGSSSSCTTGGGAAVSVHGGCVAYGRDSSGLFSGTGSVITTPQPPPPVFKFEKETLQKTCRNK